MLVSFILRLSPGSLLVGQIAGVVEHVETGKTATFRDVAELASWCARIAAHQPLPVVPDQSSPLDGAATTAEADVHRMS